VIPSRASLAFLMKETGNVIPPKLIDYYYYRPALSFVRKNSQQLAPQKWQNTFIVKHVKNSSSSFIDWKMV